MIDGVGRHDDPPVCKVCGKNYFNRISLPINFHFVKVLGC
jgi:hypothetical protein